MPKPPVLPPIFKIARYTLIDHLRQKSFVVMFLMGALCVFFSRSCYRGNYMVNGQLLANGSVAVTVAKMSFHVIAGGMLFLASLLAMRAFRYDRDGGMQACILSKPITRAQYVLGKVLGLWALALLGMFILHTIVFTILAISAKLIMPAYLTASLLCAFNLLLVIIAVLLFSLLMSDVVAMMGVMAIVLISYIADGLHALHQSQIMQAIIQQPGAGPGEVTWSKVVYYLWPKLAGLEQGAVSLIGHSGSGTWMSLYPFLNIILYCLVLAALLLWRFRDEEIL